MPKEFKESHSQMMIWIPRAHKMAIKQLSLQTGIKMNRIVAAIIRRYLENNKEVRAKEAMRFLELRKLAETSGYKDEIDQLIAKVIPGFNTESEDF